MVEPDRYWEEFCRAVERTDLIQDERFANILVRYRNSPELVKTLDQVFAARTLAQWEERLNAYNLIWSPARELSEVVHDPQARAMKYFRSVDHPTAGRFDTVGRHRGVLETRGDRLRSRRSGGPHGGRRSRGSGSDRRCERRQRGRRIPWNRCHRRRP